LSSSGLDVVSVEGGRKGRSLEIGATKRGRFASSSTRFWQKQALEDGKLVEHEEEISLILE
jgi:hypothetical protein